MPAVPRRRMHPGQKRMLWATPALFLAAFLPWLYTGVGAIRAFNGPGVFLFYAAFVALAGALIPWHRVAAVQGFLVAALALVLPVWQVLHVWRLVGFEGWLPGPGIVLSLAGAALCFIGARELLTLTPAAPDAARAG